jgi:hypothetical protein
MALGLRKISQIISFPDFFSLGLQIFIWYLVHCFSIPRYRSSSSLVLIHWNFTKLWPMDLQKYYELSVLCTFVASPPLLALQSEIVTNQNLFAYAWTILIEYLYTAGRGLSIACNTLRMLVFNGFSLMSNIKFIFSYTWISFLNLCFFQMSDQTRYYT